MIYQLLRTVKDDFRSIAKNNRYLYILSRTAKEFRNDTFYELLYGYYENDERESTLIIKHPGERCPEKIIFHMSIGEDLLNRTGFCGWTRRTIYLLGFADQYGFTPTVKWGKGCPYYDPMMDEKTDNVFEYYYKPMSGINCQEIDSYKNVIYTRLSKSIPEFKEMYDGVNRESLEKMGEIYKKYFILNQETHEYLEKELTPVLAGKRTLGVHFRGTDFCLGYKNHPIPATPEEYLEKIKEIFSTGKYDQVFLATDDANISTMFKERLGDILVYYKDITRSSGELGVMDREEKQYQITRQYKLGLDVIKDIYTLACCDGLIAGYSNVSFAAQYINTALDRKYNELFLFNKGFHEKTSKVGMKRDKKFFAQRKKLKKEEENSLKKQ